MQELHYYVAQFKQAGMHGPLSYYRTSKARYDEERECERSIIQIIHRTLLIVVKCINQRPAHLGPEVLLRSLPISQPSCFGAPKTQLAQSF